MRAQSSCFAVSASPARAIHCIGAIDALSAARKIQRAGIGCNILSNMGFYQQQYIYNEAHVFENAMEITKLNAIRRPDA